LGPDPTLIYVVVPDTSAWTRDFLSRIGSTWEEGPHPIQRPGVYRYTKRSADVHWIGPVPQDRQAQCAREVAPLF
jgi:hypothetical protein